MIYTDEFKIQDNVSARIVYMYKRNSDGKSWNFKNNLEVFDAELFAIFQTLKWMQSFDLEKIKKNLNFFWQLSCNSKTSEHQIRIWTAFND